MALDHDDISALMTALLARCGAVDRKLIGELAMASWLDTVAPDSRPGALDQAMRRIRALVDYPHWREYRPPCAPTPARAPIPPDRAG